MLGATRQPRRSVTRRIIGAEVGLGLDDAGTRETVCCLSFQNGPEKLARYQLGWSIIESNRQRRAQTRTPRDGRGVSCHASARATVFLARGFFAAAFFAAGVFALAFDAGATSATGVAGAFAAGADFFAAVLRAVFAAGALAAGAATIGAATSGAATTTGAGVGADAALAALDD